MSTKLQCSPVIFDLLNDTNFSTDLKPHIDLFKVHKCASCESAIWQRSYFLGDGSTEHCKEKNPPPSYLRCYCSVTHAYVAMEWWKVDINLKIVLNDSPNFMKCCDSYCAR